MARLDPPQPPQAFPHRETKSAVNSLLFTTSTTTPSTAHPLT